MHRLIRLSSGTVSSCSGQACHGCWLRVLHHALDAAWQQAVLLSSGHTSIFDTGCIHVCCVLDLQM